MTEPEYLLTYNASSYEWFHTEVEMIGFIKEHNIQSYEALYIPEAIEIDVEQELKE
ncbi:hypothetical protein NC797_06685 [Aquibacillus sp. 3ASR75-11]|uniref:Uncharacterized protein n=1 Tax=Terrihalobacillus insolitus TaxID=2950438 RepID=A0A9X4AN58_9BACI|nr:hypothetical protein [Terrihalobacillus insolitus]MDC3414694.1 hypothetical protein [Terrihalobacillus insolitus]MDC3424193.1 hypothetical protein [Terrihalobacillus insolitus]